MSNTLFAPQNRTYSALEVAIHGDERINNKQGVLTALRVAMDAMIRLGVYVPEPTTPICALDPDLAQCTRELEALATQYGVEEVMVAVSVVFLGTSGTDRHIAQQYLGLLLAHRQ